MDKSVIKGFYDAFNKANVGDYFHYKRFIDWGENGKKFKDLFEFQDAAHKIANGTGIVVTNNNLATNDARELLIMSCRAVTLVKRLKAIYLDLVNVVQIIEGKYRTGLTEDDLYYYDALFIGNLSRIHRDGKVAYSDNLLWQIEELLSSLKRKGISVSAEINAKQPWWGWSDSFKANILRNSLHVDVTKE